MGNKSNSPKSKKICRGKKSTPPKLRGNINSVLTNMFKEGGLFDEKTVVAYKTSDGDFNFIDIMSVLILPFNMEVFELESRLLYAYNFFILDIEHTRKFLETPNICLLMGQLRENPEDTKMTLK